MRLFLAEIEMERGDGERALVHAREARRLATCDGPPEYTYKVAYDEAGALLAKLGGRAEGDMTTNLADLPNHSVNPADSVNPAVSLLCPSHAFPYPIDET